MRISLKARIGFGAGAITLLALIASGLMIWSARETARRIEVSLAAQNRMQELSALASALSTFGVLAYESTVSGTGLAQRQAWLEGQVQAIQSAFDRIARALEADVHAASTAGLDEQSMRATRSLGLARMRAQFENLLARLADPRISADPSSVRTALDAFSTQFAPLLNDAIEEERRIHQDALDGIARLRQLLTRLGISLAITAPLLLFWFVTFQIRPLIRRLLHLGRTTGKIGREDFSQHLPTARHDEIGLLFARTNQMSARLRRRKRAVEADRADLNRIVAERTEALSAANASLAEADENRRRFFADVSHELRTPLTVILAETELAEGGGEGAGEALAVIRKRAAALNRRIDDLLRIARSESGEIALETGRVDLADLAMLALDDTERLRKRAGMETVTDLEPLEVEADASWSRQIIASLIENAIKHAGTGKVLSVSLRREGEWGCVRIADNGPGIGAEAPDRLFTRFERGAGPRRQAGFGIGLALARWVMEKQGGHIALASPASTGCQPPGTKVTLWFPAFGN